MEITARRLRGSKGAGCARRDDVWETDLTTETVQGAALALEGVHDVEGGDGLALGVLSVGDSVTDDTLEEGLEDTTGLVVDGWDALDMCRRAEK
jgi:hypothetical protein